MTNIKCGHSKNQWTKWPLLRTPVAHKSIKSSRRSKQQTRENINKAEVELLQKKLLRTKSAHCRPGQLPFLPAGRPIGRQKGIVTQDKTRDINISKQFGPLLFCNYCSASSNSFQLYIIYGIYLSCSVLKAPCTIG